MSGKSDDEAKWLLEPEPYDSYQKAPPVVHQLDDVLPPERHAWYGDATLTPNTGRTNSYDYALFGLAPHELLDRLRLSIILCSLVQFLVTFFTWWRHLFRPFQLILSLVTGAMVLVLLVVEVSSILRGEGSESSAILSNTSNNSDDNSNEAKLKRCWQATEKLGLLVLYHPIGKTAYLIVCGVLIWVVGGIADWILALLFWANAAVLLYCWVTYPEFRQRFQPPEFDAADNTGDEGPLNRDIGSRTMAWSSFSSSASNVASKLKNAVK